MFSRTRVLASKRTRFSRSVSQCSGGKSFQSPVSPAISRFGRVVTFRIPECVVVPFDPAFKSVIAEVDGFAGTGCSSKPDALLTAVLPQSS